MKRNIIAAAAALVSLGTLTACGGGGSSTAQTPTPSKYSLGGTVSNLSSSGLALSNGTDMLSVPANATTITFPTQLLDGAAYNVTVATQPLGFSSACSVTNGAGVIKAANVLNVTITCHAATALASTVAGSGESGSADGAGTLATFSGPRAIVADPAGNVYVAESQSIRKITPSGVVSTLATGFNYPRGLALDAANNLYVGNGYDVRKVSPSGVVTVLAGGSPLGFSNGTGTAARFNGAGGVAVDSAGNVYVADDYNHQIRKITPAGVTTTFAGKGQVGFIDGAGTEAYFGHPTALGISSSGDLYVLEASSGIRKISPTGVVTTVADVGRNPAANFSPPSSIVIDAAGNLYFTKDNAVRLITSKGVDTTLAGNNNRGNANGVGNAASFAYPNGIAIDGAGNLYVADTGNNLVRKISLQ